MEDLKIIFNGKEVKDLRNEKVYVELDNSIERTAVDITESDPKSHCLQILGKVNNQIILLQLNLFYAIYIFGG